MKLLSFYNWYGGNIKDCLFGLNLIRQPKTLISDEESYRSIVESRYGQYLTAFETYKGEHTGDDAIDNVTDFVIQTIASKEKLDRNALVKDIIAITALGYNATNVSGLDLISLEACSDSVGFYDHYYCQYANYSGRYDEHSEGEAWKDTLKRYIDEQKGEGGFNFQNPENVNTDDMAVMHYQPLFLLMDDKFVKDGNTVISNLSTEAARTTCLTARTWRAHGR